MHPTFCVQLSLREFSLMITSLLDIFVTISCLAFLLDFNIWSVCIPRMLFFKCCQVIQHLGWLLVGAWTLVSFFLLLFCGFFSPLFLVSVFIVFAAKLMFYLTSNDGLKEKDKRQFCRLQYHWPDSLNPELYKRKEYDLVVVIVGLVTAKDYIFG